MRWWLLVLVACGRIGFDQASSTSAPGDGRPGGDGSAALDASTDALGLGCDPTACATAGGTCTNNTCQITCGDSGCGGGVTCPPTGSCVVTCSGNNACAGGVDCSTAATCTVQCVGASSCGNFIRCTSVQNLSCVVQCTGIGSCSAPMTFGQTSAQIDCSGTSSCAGGFNCSASCGCTATCAPAASCGPWTCPPYTGCTVADGCTNLCPAGC